MEERVVLSNKGVGNILQFLTDVKYLLKGKVLVANVLPVFTAYWLSLYFAGERFRDHISLFLLTMIGSTLVISGALIINNWYEVDLDRKMVRTQKRPTVTGHFSMRAVLWAGIMTTILGLVTMLATTLEATVYSLLGWFVYVVLYTFWSKRKYTLNTVIGSISGAFTPLIGWAAVQPANHIVPIVLFAILFIWQVPHTMAVAIKRFDDYQAASVPMLPVVAGMDTAIRQNLLYIICLLPIPFFLFHLFGPILVIVSSLLTVGWIFLAAKGFSTKNLEKWAQMNLIYSLNYLVWLSFTMILLTV
jgi:heme o synthase